MKPDRQIRRRAQATARQPDRRIVQVSTSAVDPRGMVESCLLQAVAQRAPGPGRGVLGTGAVVMDADTSFAACLGTDRDRLAGDRFGALVNPEDVRTLAAHLDSRLPDEPIPIRGVGDGDRPFAADLWLLDRSDAGLVDALAVPPASYDDELAHALSHDLRGRIRTVRSCMSLVRNEVAGTEDERLLDLLARTERASDTAMRMVTALVDDLRQQDFDVLEAVPLDDVVVAASSGIDAAVTARCPLGTVLANRAALIEAAGEVLGNAARYAVPSDGGQASIDVRARDLGRWVEIRIEDSGSGFRTDTPDDAFDMFRQFQARDWASGLGFGLVVTRRLIEAQGGRVRAANGDAGGVVTITLARPMAQELSTAQA